MNSINRRNFLRNIVVAPMLPMVPLSLSCGSSHSTISLTYLTRFRSILSKIVSTELSQLRDASNIFAETLIARNHCFSYIEGIVNSHYFVNESVRIPNVFIPLHSREMAETIRQGDALLISSPGDIPTIARTKGARIIGIASPLVADSYSQNEIQKFTTPQRFDTHLDMVLRSNVPFGDGLVTIPEYPFNILPGSGPVFLTIITALAGEIYRRSGGIGLTRDSNPDIAHRFITSVIHRTAQLKDQWGTIQKAGEIIGEKILSGGRIWAYDSQDILRFEISRCSGVPAFLKALDRNQITKMNIGKNDAVILGALKSNDIDDVNTARTIRGITPTLITLCPHDNKGGYRLFNDASATFDNLSPEEDGLIQFDNGTKTLLQTGSILNVALFWTIIGEAISHMIMVGKVPGIFMAPYLIGSKQHNADTVTKQGTVGY
jgi:uncharacterized phosphosugar-binding protein